jgi:hypothetical protein
MFPSRIFVTENPAVSQRRRATRNLLQSISLFGINLAPIAPITLMIFQQK